MYKQEIEILVLSYVLITLSRCVYFRYDSSSVCSILHMNFDVMWKYVNKKALTTANISFMKVNMKLVSDLRKELNSVEMCDTFGFNK